MSKLVLVAVLAVAVLNRDMSKAPLARGRSLVAVVPEIKAARRS